MESGETLFSVIGHQLLADLGTQGRARGTLTTDNRPPKTVGARLARPTYTSPSSHARLVRRRLA
jgi:hypothetical protein